jgi:electron transfer flavoprotein alpha subunit
MDGVLSCLPPGFEWDQAIQGLLGEAERLARRQDAEHAVLVTGRAAEPLIGQVAQLCGRLIVIDDAGEVADHPESWLQLLTAICTDRQPAVVLLGDDTRSQELAPRLAHRLSGSSVGDAFSIDASSGRLRVVRSVYGGKALATLQLNRMPAVISLRSRSFASAAPRSESAPIENTKFPWDDEHHRSLGRTTIVERHEEAAGSVRLEDARVIVAGGRGLGGPEPFEDLKQLAKILGGELAASRAPCDAGWVEPNLQVGQTGKKVAPDFYLAVAVSGASQHVMGVTDAKVIAAINSDEDAPIFRHCQFGLVEDYRQVIGLLREQLTVLLS